MILIIHLVCHYFFLPYLQRNYCKLNPSLTVLFCFFSFFWSLLGTLPELQLNECLTEYSSWFNQWRSHSKWMFDISPVLQANLALWHAITQLITAVCGLEGTQAGLVVLTGPDRLIRSAGTQNSNSQTPHISSLAHNSLQVQETLFATLVLWHLFFSFSVLTSVALTLFHFLAGFRFLWNFYQTRLFQVFCGTD